MKTCVFAQRFYVQNLCEKNVLHSLLLSDSSTGNGVISTMQFVVNKQEMMFFSELKAIEECYDITTVPEIALILKFSHEQCRQFVY